MKEDWKFIKGYEDWYQINSDGIVRSMERTVIYPDGHKQRYKEKILKPCIDSTGYLMVVLTKNRKRKSKRIHQMLMETFRPTNEENMVIDHINRNKLDNRLENLRWVKQSVNVRNCKIKFRPDIRKIGNGFQVRFQMDGVRKHIGYTKSYDDAIALYTEHYKRRQTEYDRRYMG